MLAIFIVLLGITIILMSCMLKDEDTDTGTFSAGIVIGIALLSLLIGIFVYIFQDFIKSKQIKPIDVYRGNTTLEITYRDSIAIDSVVIWKNKYIS